MTGAAAAGGSKLDPFVANSHSGPLATLVSGKEVYTKRGRTSRARSDYGESACGKMLAIVASGTRHHTNQAVQKTLFEWRTSFFFLSIFLSIFL